MGTMRQRCEKAERVYAEGMAELDRINAQIAELQRTKAPIRQRMAALAANLPTLRKLSEAEQETDFLDAEPAT